MSDFFTDAGFTLPTSEKKQPDDSTGALFKAAGFSVPTDKAMPANTGAQFSDEIPIPVPGTPAYDNAKVNDPATADTLENNLAAFTNAIRPTTVAGNLASDFLQSTKTANAAGTALVKSGLNDIQSRNYLPSFPSVDPSTWSAGGLLKTAAGGLAAVPMAPVTGAIDALVTHPVTALTGNPEIGERAGALAGLMIPGPKAISVAKDVVPANRAINTLVDAIGPENVPAAVARLSENPRLSLMDVSDPVRTLAQGLIDPAQPAAQNILSDAVKARAATAPAAVNAAYTQAMGPSPDVPKMVDALKGIATNVGKQMIEPALENADPVPIKPLLKVLDKQIGSPEAIAGETPRIPLDPTQIKLLNLRNQITNGEMAPLNERVGLSIGPINDAIKAGGMSDARLADFTEARRLLNSARRGYTSEDDLVSGLSDLADKQKIVGPIDNALTMIQKGPTEVRSADFLHGIQSRLREYAQNLSQSSVGSERAMSSDLFNARENLINNIDKAAGGEYRPALAKYRDAMQIQEAFESGFDTLKNRPGMAGLDDRPEAFADWMNNATPEQIVARRLGTRADIDQKINGMRFAARRGTDIPDIEYNAQKLKMLFGDQEASRLIQVMHDFRDEALTNSKILANSKTAETLAGREALKVPEVEPFKLGSLTSALLPSVMAEGLAEYSGMPPGLTGLGLLAGGVGLGATRKAYQSLLKSSAVNRNIAIARAASAVGQSRQDLFNSLLSHPSVIRAAQKQGTALMVP